MDRIRALPSITRAPQSPPFPTHPPYVNKNLACHQLRWTDMNIYAFKLPFFLKAGRKVGTAVRTATCWDPYWSGRCQCTGALGCGKREKGTISDHGSIEEGTCETMTLLMNTDLLISAFFQPLQFAFCHS